MSFLEVNHIDKQGETNFILKEIHFKLRKFQKLVIAGETGSGKSTLLKIIAGLAQADKGEVLLNEVRIKGPEEKLVPGHPAISYLSQYFELPHALRVEQVLAYANELDQTEAKQLYEICQIQHLLQRKTNQLSGGEQQRIALARLLTTSPQLLLLDEPFSHLDMAHKITLKSVLKDISTQLKITCILVSHDPSDALPWADQIIVLKEGGIIQKGTPEKIYHEPVNEYVAGLFGQYQLLNTDQLLLLTGSTIKITKKKALVRPEHFKIDLKKKTKVTGKITQVDFLGSYYEADVMLGNNQYRVKTELQLKKGDKVHLSVPSGLLRFI
jgi:ABC-type sugar transport system ATPase subunit